MKKLNVAGIILLAVSVVLLGAHLVAKFFFRTEIFSSLILTLIHLIAMVGMIITTVCTVKENKSGNK